MFLALAHDFVLRRNCRVAFGSKNPTPFTISSNGTHHVRLISHLAAQWNDLLGKDKRAAGAPRLVQLPGLQVVSSGEMFGLVSSEYTNTFKGLIEVKMEAEDEDLLDKQEVDTFDPAEMLRSMNIDPSLVDIPETRTISTPASAPQVPVISAASGHLITTPTIDLTTEATASGADSNRNGSDLAAPPVATKRKSESVLSRDESNHTKSAPTTSIKRVRIDGSAATEEVSTRTIIERDACTDNNYHCFAAAWVSTRGRSCSREHRLFLQGQKDGCFCDQCGSLLDAAYCANRRFQPPGQRESSETQQVGAAVLHRRPNRHSLAVNIY